MKKVNETIECPWGSFVWVALSTHSKADWRSESDASCPSDCPDLSSWPALNCPQQQNKGDAKKKKLCSTSWFRTCLRWQQDVKPFYTLDILSATFHKWKGVSLQWSSEFTKKGFKIVILCSVLLQHKTPLYYTLQNSKSLIYNKFNLMMYFNFSVSTKGRHHPLSTDPLTCCPPHCRKPGETTELIFHEVYFLEVFF